MSKQEIKIKGAMERESVAARLEELVACIKEGRVNIQSHKDSISLNLAQAIKMEIKAKSGKDKEKIEIELSWQTDKDADIKPVEMAITSEIQESEGPEAVSENPPPDDYLEKTPATSGPTIAVHEDSKEKDSSPEAEKNQSNQQVKKVKLGK